MGRNFYLSVDSYFPKVNILSEWERSTEKVFATISTSTFHLEEYLYWANKCNANIPPLGAGGHRHKTRGQRGNCLQNMQESSHSVLSKWKIALTLQYYNKCH